jgi:hypothetical protein
MLSPSGFANNLLGVYSHEDIKAVPTENHVAVLSLLKSMGFTEGFHNKNWLRLLIKAGHLSASFRDDIVYCSDAYVPSIQCELNCIYLGLVDPDCVQGGFNMHYLEARKQDCVPFEYPDFEHTLADRLKMVQEGKDIDLPQATTTTKASTDKEFKRLLSVMREMDESTKSKITEFAAEKVKQFQAQFPLPRRQAFEFDNWKKETMNDEELRDMNVDELAVLEVHLAKFWHE